MIQFDPHTRRDWADRGVKVVSVSLIASGCAGTTLQIHEGDLGGDYIPLESEVHGTQILAQPRDHGTLQDAYITHTGTKWILKSTHVLHHCGCGKSFRAKTGDERMDKILLLRSKLRKTKHL